MALRITQAETPRVATLHAASDQAARAHDHAEYFLLLRGGKTVPPNVIEQLCQIMEANPAAAVLAPLLVSGEDERLPIQYCVIEDQCLRRPLRAIPVVPDGDEPIETLALRCDCALIRRTALWGAGGFGQFKSEMAADLNLCYALNEQGWKTTILPKIQVRSETLEDQVLPVEDDQCLTKSWYGRFKPVGLRTPDGVLRWHCWEHPDLVNGIEDQRIVSAFAPPRFASSPANAQRPTPNAFPGERCSVVIVTYNSIGHIERCLESVLSNLGTFDEVIVVDNASRDATAAYLQSIDNTDPRLKVILSDRNLGFSAGSNLGIKHADGEYVVLLNPDTVVHEGWLARMRNYFADPHVAAVGPISDGVAGQQQFHVHLPQDLNGTLTPEQVADLTRRVNARRGIEVKLLIGFCMMFRKSALDQVGLLDEKMFLGSDDLDISWRLRNAGHKLLVATDVFVRHAVHASFETEPKDATDRLQKESADVLARKLIAFYGEGNVPPQKELWGIPWFESSVPVWP